MSDNFEPINLPVKKAAKGKKVLVVSVAILLALVTGAAVYFWQQMSVKDLESKNKQQTSEIESLKSAGSPEDKADTPEAKTTETKVENLTAAIASRNYAALEGSMASSVRVIIAASEGVGDRTPAQAVSDLGYLNSATAPWNFNIEADTLNQWRAGDYASYVPYSAVVGESTNQYVVSFQFNHEGKISVIFMSVNSDLM